MMTVKKSERPIASGRPVVLYLLGQALNLVLTLGMASLTFGWLFRKAVAP